MTLTYPLILHPLADLHAILIEQLATHLLTGNTSGFHAIRVLAKKIGCRITDADLSAYVGVPYTVTDLEKAGTRVRSNSKRARRFGCHQHISALEWLNLCHAAGFRCAICGSDRPLTVDHIQPLSAGGSNELTNIQPVCEACNFGRDRCGDDVLLKIINQ